MIKIIWRVFRISIMFVIVVGFAMACRDIYRAGSGMQYLDYRIETRLNHKLIMSYIDSTKSHKVPEKWDHFHKLDDLAPEDNKRIYFSCDPEEMYLISSGGMFTLADVFDPIELSWISNPSLISTSEETRTRNRFAALLDTIEMKAKMKGLPDSAIYGRDPFTGRLK